MCWCPLAVCKEDWEPPFLPGEALKFCKVNTWAFAFPPLMGGTLSEWWAQHSLASRRLALGPGGHGGPWLLSRGGGGLMLWSARTFMMN